MIDSFVSARAWLLFLALVMCVAGTYASGRVPVFWEVIMAGVVLICLMASFMGDRK